MGTPQIILIILHFAGLILAIKSDGKQVKVKFINTLLSSIITFSLLFAGGFFNVK